MRSGFLALGCLAFLACVALPARLMAQPEPQAAAPAPWVSPAEGGKTSLLRSLLKHAGVTPVTVTSDGNPSELIMVLVGEIPRDYANFAALVYASGGAVVVASDQPTVLDDVFGRGSRLRISGDFVQVREPTERACYRSIPNMPYFTYPRELEPFQDLFLVRMTQLQKVATDIPSYFPEQPRPSPGSIIQPLGVYPQGTRVDGARTGIAFRAAALHISDSELRHRGVGLVYADAGPFTNRMLLASDSDNFAYAFYLTRYLTGDGNERVNRNKCLFIENGEIRSDFDEIPLIPSQLPIPPVPVPSFEKIQEVITDTANNALDRIQTEDVLGRAAERGFSRLLAIGLFVLAIVALLWWYRRAWAQRHQANLKPIPTSLRVPDADAQSTLDQQRKLLLRGNNFAEPVRGHIREMLTQWGAPDTTGALPALEVAGPRSEQRRIRQQLESLWTLANDDTPRTVNYEYWRDIEDTIHALDQAYRSERWRFTTPGGPA